MSDDKRKQSHSSYGVTASSPSLNEMDSEVQLDKDVDLDSLPREELVRLIKRLRQPSLPARQRSSSVRGAFVDTVTTATNAAAAAAAHSSSMSELVLDAAGPDGVVSDFVAATLLSVLSPTGEVPSTSSPLHRRDHVARCSSLASSGFRSPVGRLHSFSSLSTSTYETVDGVGSLYDSTSRRGVDRRGFTVESLRRWQRPRELDGLPSVECHGLTGDASHDSSPTAAARGPPPRVGWSAGSGRTTTGDMTELDGFLCPSRQHARWSGLAQPPNLPVPPALSVMLSSVSAFALSAASADAPLVSASSSPVAADAWARGAAVESPLAADTPEASVVEAQGAAVEGTPLHQRTTTALATPDCSAIRQSGTGTVLGEFPPSPQPLIPNSPPLQPHAPSHRRTPRSSPAPTLTSAEASLLRATSPLVPQPCTAQESAPLTADARVPAALVAWRPFDSEELPLRTETYMSASHPSRSSRTRASSWTGARASALTDLSSDDNADTRLFTPQLGPSEPGANWSANATTTLDASSGSPNGVTAQMRETAYLRKMKSASTGACYLNNYRVVRSLGRGACGKVKLAFDNAERRLVAIKSVRRADTRKRLGGMTMAQLNFKAFMREIEIMKQLRHNNIVSLYEVIDDPKADKLYLVMQYVERGVIAKVQVRNGSDCVCDPVPPPQLARYTREMLAGLQYLHDHNVVHRDIKPDNILVSDDGHAYLADFGVAETFDTSYRQRIEAVMAQSAALDTTMSATGGPQVLGTKGTPLFIAPELWGGAKSYGKPVDMWAMGVTLFTLLVGKLPFRCPENITDASVTPTVPAQFGEEWCTLIGGLLDRDPLKRWTVETASEFVQRAKLGEQGTALDAECSLSITVSGSLMLPPPMCGAPMREKEADSDQGSGTPLRAQPRTSDSDNSLPPSGPPPGEARSGASGSGSGGAEKRSAGVARRLCPASLSHAATPTLTSPRDGRLGAPLHGASPLLALPRIAEVLHTPPGHLARCGSAAALSERSVSVLGPGPAAHGGPPVPPRSPFGALSVTSPTSAAPGGCGGSAPLGSAPPSLHAPVRRADTDVDTARPPLLPRPQLPRSLLPSPLLAPVAKSPAHVRLSPLEPAAQHLPPHHHHPQLQRRSAKAEEVYNTPMTMTSSCGESSDAANGFYGGSENDTITESVASALHLSTISSRHSGFASAANTLPAGVLSPSAATPAMRRHGPPRGRSRMRSLDAHPERRFITPAAPPQSFACLHAAFHSRHSSTSSEDGGDTTARTDSTPSGPCPHPPVEPSPLASARRSHRGPSPYTIGDGGRCACTSPDTPSGQQSTSTPPPFADAAPKPHFSDRLPTLLSSTSPSRHALSSQHAAHGSDHGLRILDDTEEKP